MSQRKFFVTGGLGCIGAETTKWLLATTTDPIVICGRDMSAERLERVFPGVDRERLLPVVADVTDQSLLSRILREHEVSHVIHLAALQTPDCNRHRDLGLQINLGGTQKLIEAMKENIDLIQRFVFASSVAVYGPRASYPEGPVPMLAEPQPVNVYGAWKLAGENISRMFAADTGIATLSLRPGVLFGPGRDAGLTSTPTTAMKHVALGLPYQIPFRNRQDYLYAPDVGAAFGHATTEPFNGYGVFTLPSHTLQTSEIVASIQSAADRLGIAEKCELSIGDEDVPFICDLEYQPFCDAFPKAPVTPIDAAIEDSIRTFRDQGNKGLLQPAAP